MNRRVLFLWAICVPCVTLSGCVTPPAADPPATPAPVPGPVQAAPTPAAALEERHHAHAQAFMRERNWADALVQWELLALLKPDSQEYRNALIATRARIREAADGFMRAANQARAQGNLDQATLMYLRVLNVDRENAVAAQALRDIDAERTRRSYINRPPR